MTFIKIFLTLTFIMFNHNVFAEDVLPKNQLGQIAILTNNNKLTQKLIFDLQFEGRDAVIMDKISEKEMPSHYSRIALEFDKSDKITKIVIGSRNADKKDYKDVYNFEADSSTSPLSLDDAKIEIVREVEKLDNVP